MMAYPAGILRAGLAFRRKNLRPPQQPGGFYSKFVVWGALLNRRSRQQKIPVGGSV
jgi:hypothetical protein